MRQGAWSQLGCTRTGLLGKQSCAEAHLVAIARRIYLEVQLWIVAVQPVLQ